MTAVAVCNNDCICVDGDCKFYHPIPKQDRKIVRKLYEAIDKIDKTEPNSETRKANCRNGKLCYSKNCGFRHRLCFSDRMKLNEGLSRFKLEATKTKKEPAKISVGDFEIETRNLFAGLKVEEIVEVPEVVPKVVPKVVPNVDKKRLVVYDRWEDMADDEDFYMKF